MTVQTLCVKFIEFRGNVESMEDICGDRPDYNAERFAVQRHLLVISCNYFFF